MQEANLTLRHIAERRSIRRFSEQNLEPAQIDTLIECALASPTAMNRQGIAFRFIVDQNLIERLNSAAQDTFRRNGDQAVLDRIAGRHPSIFYGAPLLVLITVPNDNRSTHLDAGIAVQTLALAAQSMGLGSCIIGMAAASFDGPESAALKRDVDWPDGHRFGISIAIGHPAIGKEAAERRPERVRIIGDV